MPKFPWRFTITARHCHFHFFKVMRSKPRNTKFNPKTFILTPSPEADDFGIERVIRRKPGSTWNKGAVIINPPLTSQSTSRPSEPPDSQSQPSVQGVEQLTSQWESLDPQTSFSLLSDEPSFEYEDDDSLFSTCQRWHFEDED
jgi:hypothetical protein